MPEKADARLLGIKVGGLQEGRQIPTTAEAKYVGARAESKYATAFTTYEDLYINVIKPAIPDDIGTGMHGMLRSVGYKLYKNLQKVRSADTATAVRDGIVASFVEVYGAAMEDAINAVADAVMAFCGFA